LGRTYFYSYRDRKHMVDVESGVMSAKTQNGENAGQLIRNEIIIAAIIADS